MPKELASKTLGEKHIKVMSRFAALQGSEIEGKGQVREKRGSNGNSDLMLLSARTIVCMVP